MLWSVVVSPRASRAVEQLPSARLEATDSSSGIEGAYLQQTKNRKPNVKHLAAVLAFQELGLAPRKLDKGGLLTCDASITRCGKMNGNGGCKNATVQCPLTAAFRAQLVKMGTLCEMLLHYAP